MDEKSYAKQILRYLLYVSALTAVCALHALVQRWVGVVPPVPPPPPPPNILITGPDGEPVRVTVVQTGK